MVALLPLSGWAIWQWSYVDQRSPLPPLALAGVLLALYAVAQYGLSVVGFRGDALLAAGYSLSFAMAVLTGYQIQRVNTTLFDGKSLRVFWLAWVAAGVVSLGMALHQWLDLSYFGLLIAEMPRRGRPFANLAQPNHLATLLLLSVAGVLYLHETRVLSKVSTWLTLTVFCFGLAMTGSRSVLLGMMFALLASALIRRKSVTRFPAWGMLALFLIYLLWAALWPLLNKVLLLDNVFQATLSRTAPGIRVIYWMSAWDAFMMKPWLGWGFGQIGLAQQATALNYPATYTFFSSAHNIVLDLLLWTGAPMCLLLIWAGAKHVSRCRSAATSGDARWTAWIGLAFIGGHAMVEFPLSYLYFLIPFGLLWGVLYEPKVAATPIEAGTLTSIAKSRSAVAVGLIGLSLLAKGTLEYLSWEEDAQNLSFELQNYDKTAEPYTPSWTLFDQVRAMHHVARAAPARHMPDQELALFKKNAGRYPSSVALLRYAYAAGLNGQAQEARHTLTLLCSLHVPAICQAARLEWKNAGDQSWPELKAIDFPAPQEYKANEQLILFNHPINH